MEYVGSTDLLVCPNFYDFIPISMTISRKLEPVKGAVQASDRHRPYARRGPLRDNAMALSKELHGKVMNETVY